LLTFYDYKIFVTISFYTAVTRRKTKSANLW